MLADRDKDALATVATTLGAEALETDVRDEKQVAHLVQTSELHFGHIDLYCSNAGILGHPGLLEVPTEAWNDIWAVNVLSHVFAAKYALPAMRRRGEGYLVITASAAGLLNQIGAAGYATTKHAAVGFAEWLQITYGAEGIRVSCLCPQAVRTAMTAQGAGVAGVDGMIEPSECATEVLRAVEAETFLITPHPKVREYIQRKAADYDRWLSGMQRLQAKYTDWLQALHNHEGPLG